MKKSLSILAITASLTAFGFAAEPVANLSLSEFTGSAEFGFKTNFTDSKNVQFGMFNNNSASINFGIIKGGDKITTGDGVWGELKIACDDTNINYSKVKIGNTKPVEEGGTGWIKEQGLDNNIYIDPVTKDVYLLKQQLVPTPRVETAKIHLSDNDIYASLDLLKPTIKYQSNLVTTILPNTDFYLGSIVDEHEVARYKLIAKIGKDDTKGLRKDISDLKKSIKEEKDTTKIENLTKELKEKENEIKELRKELSLLPPVPTSSGIIAANNGLSAIGNETGLEKGAGFGFNFGIKDLFDSNLKLLDNGVVSKNNKKFGLAFDVSLKAIKDLTTKVYGSYNFSEKYYSFGADAAYKLYFTDALFLQPGLSYTLVKEGEGKNQHNLKAGLLLGWGNEEKKPGFKYLAEKAKEGVSFSITNDFKDGNLGPRWNEIDSNATNFLNFSSLTKIVTGLYDESLFSLLGLEEYGKLKTGFSSVTNLYKAYSELAEPFRDDFSVMNNVIAAGIKYLVDIKSSYIEIGGDYQYINTEVTVETTTSENVSTEEQNKNLTEGIRDGLFADLRNSQIIAWSFKIGSNKLIDNTDIYALYEGEYKNDKLSNNSITVGTKISF